MTTHDYRLDEMCKHGFPTPVDCPVCKGHLDPVNVGPMVWVSAYGNVYHFDRACDRLAFGQQMVEDSGGTPAPIESVPQATAELDKPPCPYCRPKGKK